VAEAECPQQFNDRIHHNNARHSGIALAQRADVRRPGVRRPGKRVRYEILNRGRPASDVACSL
jgi:hypothetical protein